MNGHSGLEKSACIHLKEFLEVASDVMGLMTSTQQIDYYFDMFSGGQPTINIDGKYPCWSELSSLFSLTFSI